MCEILRKKSERLPRKRQKIRGYFFRTLYATMETTMQLWCFAAAGPILWNSLSADLRQGEISFEQFKRLLKTCVGIAAHCD